MKDRAQKLPLKALFLFLALLWGQLIMVLWPSWSDEGSYYDYGRLIPLVILLLVWRRVVEEDVELRPLSSRLNWFVLAAGLALLIPLRVVEEVDVFWRLPLWIHGVLVLALTFLTVRQAAGHRWAMTVLPSAALLLFAIPLPSFLESRLVHFLTGAVLELVAVALPLAGYPVEVAGNALVVKGELLDVTDGCSGIRSFQSCTVAGICLGAILRFSFGRRILLCLSALLIAVIANAGRIVALAKVAYREGKDEMDLAHDPIGLVAVVLTYLGIAVVAWLLTISITKRTRVRTVNTTAS